MSQPFNSGIYDPDQLMASLTSFTIEANFASWSPWDNSSVTSWLATVASRNRSPLLTIQCYAGSGLSANIVGDITAGAYDATLNQICATLNAGTYATKAVPIVRILHNMEMVSPTFPWASPDTAASIAAFRYIVHYMQAQLTVGIHFMWSPVGDDQRVPSYWPGRDVVDLVGSSLYIWSQYELDYQNPPLIRSFADQMAAKYGILSPFNKPIMVAECGISYTGAGSGFGYKGAKRKWLFDAFNAIKSGTWPLLTTLVYSNFTDNTGAWSRWESQNPDFHVSFSVFTSWFGN
jgi:beta-mannanase